MVEDLSSHPSWHYWVDAFIRDVQMVGGQDDRETRGSIRDHFRKYADMIRGPHQNTQAAEDYRLQCCERLVQEIDKHKGTPAEHRWQIVLSVLNEGEASASPR